MHIVSWALSCVTTHRAAVVQPPFLWLGSLKNGQSILNKGSLLLRSSGHWATVNGIEYPPHKNDIGTENDPWSSR